MGQPSRNGYNWGPEWLSPPPNGSAGTASAAPAASPSRNDGRPERRRGRGGWAAALAELRTLQAEYEAWRDQLPESLADSRTAELLEEVCAVDLDALDVELPRGFGRD